MLDQSTFQGPRMLGSPDLLHFLCSPVLGTRHSPHLGRWFHMNGSCKQERLTASWKRTNNFKMSRLQLRWIRLFFSYDQATKQGGREAKLQIRRVNSMDKSSTSSEVETSSIAICAAGVSPSGYMCHHSGPKWLK